MKAKCLCIAETNNEYSTKQRGLQCDLVLTFLDQCDSGARLLNTFDFIVRQDEKAPYAGKSMGKTFELGLTSGEVFRNRLRFEGKVLTVDNKPAVNGKQ